MLKQEPEHSAPVTPPCPAVARPRPSCSARFKRAQHLAFDGDATATPVPLPSSAPVTPNPPSVRVAPSGAATRYYTPTPPSPALSHCSLPPAAKVRPPVPSARPVARPLVSSVQSSAPADEASDAESAESCGECEGDLNSGKYGMIRDPTTGLASRPHY